MSVTSISRWHDSALHPSDDDLSGFPVLAADSWLVDNGVTLAIDLHRIRFLDAIGSSVDAARSDAADPDAANSVAATSRTANSVAAKFDSANSVAAISDATNSDSATSDAANSVAANSAAATSDAANFWDAAIASIPRTGSWFPRVELRRHDNGAQFFFRLRDAPERTRSVRLATHAGRDPRTSPRIKGPDTDALLLARAEARAVGADEAVILSSDGYIVEGAYSALLWWRGEALCTPSPELARVDSVTARSVITLASALGIDVLYESVAPQDLDGLEIWALSALHGIRIVTGWVDGPSPAEVPGRLGVWRARLDRLRRPL